MGDAKAQVFAAQDEINPIIKARTSQHVRQSSDSAMMGGMMGGKHSRQAAPSSAQRDHKPGSSTPSSSGSVFYEAGLVFTRVIVYHQFVALLFSLSLTAIMQGACERRKRDRIKARAAKMKTLYQIALKDSTKKDTRLLEQVIPTESNVHDAVPNVQTTKDMHMPMKPGFSLPVMSSNFRRFNARIGVVFVFQNKVIHLLSWTYPTQTLAAMAIFTFLVLHPVLIPMIPPLITLFYIVIPAYLSRHPPAPSPQLPSLASSIAGPPLAPPKTIAPASDFSSDFLRNMRDLQNTMGDFANGHDALVAAIAPATNFSDETRSTALFCTLVLACGLISIGANFIPWRAMTLVVGWSAFGLGHPDVQTMVVQHYDEIFAPPTKRLRAGFRAWARKDVILDEAPEVAEVEIFEVQRRVGGTFSSFAAYSPTIPGSPGSPALSSSSGGSGVIEYEPWIFSPSSWEPRAPARVSGDRIKGSRFFEDVAPPEGWEWKQKKWVLDLASTEWLQARMLGDVEVENEGERWVYDVEEIDGKTKRGEWRRRRWIRLVQRRVYRVPSS